jgi:hemoglobin
VQSIAQSFTKDTLMSHFERRSFSFIQRAAMMLAFVAVIAIGGTRAHAQPTTGSDAALSGFGGLEGLRTMTNDFVLRIQKNPRTAPFFADSDVPKLTKSLTEQFCELLGGPCRYTGRNMKAVHTGMNVRTADFNALAEELQLAMIHAGVANAEQYRLIALLAPMQRDVVGQ